VSDRHTAAGVEGPDREIAQAGFAAFNRGDIDAVLELCDPEIVVRDPQRTGRTFRGLDGVREFFEEWLENWEEYRSEPIELTEVGDGMLVHAKQSGKGKLSGVEIDQDLFIAFRMRDGKFVEYCLYTEREDALASLGAAE
jgi:ketosteroid isomerase-like protein